eukprot:2112180-Alexandrium_andersonii.AAC.1
MRNTENTQRVETAKLVVCFHPSADGSVRNVGGQSSGLSRPDDRMFWVLLEVVLLGSASAY